MSELSQEDLDYLNQFLATFGECNCIYLPNSDRCVSYLDGKLEIL